MLLGGILLSGRYPGVAQYVALSGLLYIVISLTFREKGVYKPVDFGTGRRRRLCPLKIDGKASLYSSQYHNVSQNI